MSTSAPLDAGRQSRTRSMLTAGVLFSIVAIFVASGIDLNDVLNSVVGVQQYIGATSLNRGQPSPSAVPAMLASSLWHLPRTVSAADVNCSKVEAPPFDSLLWIVVETRLDKALKDLCNGVWKTFARFSLHIILLGSWEKRERSDWWYYSYKLQAVHKFLSAHQHEAPARGANTLVVHADASDMILFGDQRELIACISNMYCSRGWDPATDVVFVGERGLWPESRWYNKSWYPATSGDYRFLNGLYMGSWDAVRALMNAAGDVERLIKTTDDQEILNYLLLYTPWGAHMHLDQAHVCLGSSYESQNFFSLDGGRWRHKGNGGVPTIMHYNGGSKLAEFPPSLAAVEATKWPWSDARLAGGLVTRIADAWNATTSESMASLCAGAPT